MERVSLTDSYTSFPVPTKMNYWIIKGNPSLNDWDNMLQPNAREVWYTGRTPKIWAQNDRVFFWESTPKLRIVGLGVMAETDRGKDEQGRCLFEVQYLTRRLNSTLSIHELRQTSVVENASFLKSGPASTVFPLTENQALTIFRMLAARNPDIKSVWSDMDVSIYGESVLDIEELNDFAKEGGKRLTTHFVRERNRGIINAKKKQVLSQTDRLVCEVCTFDFEKTYGAIGEGFCEVHHLIPLSETESETATRLDDLAVLCSNCHRMIHKTNPLMTVEKLRSLIRPSEV